MPSFSEFLAYPTLVSIWLIWLICGPSSLLAGLKQASRRNDDEEEVPADEPNQSDVNRRKERKRRKMREGLFNRMDRMDRMRPGILSILHILFLALPSGVLILHQRQAA